MGSFGREKALFFDRMLIWKSFVFDNFFVIFLFQLLKKRKREKKNNEKQNGIGKKWYLSVEFRLY